MDAPFPPLADKRRFPLLALLSDAPYAQLMGCDDLVFMAPESIAAASFATRPPGVAWHLYGDTLWPTRSTWVEFPLKNFGTSDFGGVLVLSEAIPEKTDPFAWAAENHPLAQILPSMRADAAIRKMTELLKSQATSEEQIAGPDNQTPGYVQGYCIYRGTASGEVNLVATYTDILNTEGIPIQKFRIGNVEPANVPFCQFSLHALFRLNESRLAGSPFLEYPQFQTFGPTLMAGDAVPPKWSQFHPSRTLRTRPTLRSLPSPELMHDVMKFDDFQIATDLRRREANAHMLAFDRSARPHETALATMNSDVNASMAAFLHRAHGGAIYVLPDPLVEEFNHTDCGEVRVGDITLPFASVFLKFSPPHPVKLSDSADVDGCYITKQEDEFLFMLTARLQGVDYEHSMSIACVDPMFSLHLPAGDPEMTINSAVELGIEEFLKGNAPPTEDQSTTIKRPDGTVSEIVDVRAKSRKRRIEEFRSQEPAFRACLNIVVNAACFIAFRPDDISDGWEGTPPDDVIVAASTTDDSRRSRDKKAGALQKIENGDFTRIKICGRSLFAEDQGKLGVGGGKSPRVHWRRGHWRRQRHGVGLALVVLRWIRPTIVKKDNGTLVEARVYEL